MKPRHEQHAFSKRIEALQLAGEKLFQATKDHTTWMTSAPKSWEEMNRRDANLQRRWRRFNKRQNDLIKDVLKARDNAQTT